MLMMNGRNLWCFGTIEGESEADWQKPPYFREGEWLGFAATPRPGTRVKEKRLAMSIISGPFNNVSCSCQLMIMQMTAGSSSTSKTERLKRENQQFNSLLLEHTSWVLAGTRA